MMNATIVFTNENEKLSENGAETYDMIANFFNVKFSLINFF